MPRHTSTRQADGSEALAVTPPQAPPTPDLDSSNSASTLIEAPVPPAERGEAGARQLKRHDFPEGGGSGGAEAFRRKDK